MTPEEIKRHRRLNFRQTNAFAMQYGAIMGLYVFAAEACFVLGLKIGGLMTLQTLLTLAYPAVIIWLAFRFRNQVSEGLPYSFGRGFFFTLLVVLYSGIWASLAALIYLQFFDGGYLFQTYLEVISRPDTVKAMQDGANRGVQRWTHPGTNRRTAAAYAGFRVCCHDTLFFHSHGPGILTRGGAFHHAWCP